MRISPLNIHFDTIADISLALSKDKGFDFAVITFSQNTVPLHAVSMQQL
jgi:hypothetical protein